MSVCCGGRRLTDREEGGASCGSASGFGRVSGSVPNQFEDGMTGILLLWERQSQGKPPGAFSASQGMSDGSRQEVRPLNSFQLRWWKAVAATVGVSFQSSTTAANPQPIHGMEASQNSYRDFCFCDWPQTGVSTTVPSAKSCDEIKGDIIISIFSPFYNEGEDSEMLAACSAVHNLA